MRHDVTVGTVLGLVLGGLVIFGLAEAPSPTPDHDPTLAPLELSDFAGLDDPSEVSTDGGHRPVRPGSQRLLQAEPARS